MDSGELGKAVAINRTNPDNLRPRFSNDFIVAHTLEEFFITFSVVEPPPITSESELDELTGVDAVAVSKLSITPEFAKRIRNAMTINIEKHEKQFGQIEISSEKKEERKEN